MIKKILDFFTRRKSVKLELVASTDPSFKGYDDPAVNEMIQKTFETGKPMVGSYDDDGNFTSQPADESDEVED